jgi:GDP-L-fucose synthase
MDLTSKRILVTGGSGFLGTHLIATLRNRGCTQISAPGHQQFELTRENDVRRLYAEVRPEVVLHLAAIVGGIGANRANPGRFLYDNSMMGLLLIEHARLSCVEKFVALGTICAYPKHTPVPFREEDLWNGYPEETNAPYGLAKKMMLVQAQAYREQYGFNAIYLLPVNLYGPGDHFDLENTHVIPALILKCLGAISRGDSEVLLWGDGTPTREFLYVDDCAEAIVLAAERYERAEPVNVGAGFEISIRQLAELIAELTGFRGRIAWDTSKPNGQPRRMLDTSRAKSGFGFEAHTPFREGLKHTIDWYRRELPMRTRDSGSTGGSPL